MADYFTQFSCVLDVGSSDNVARALKLHREMELAYAAFEQSEMGFAIEPNGPTSICMHDGDGFGDQEHVIEFVLRCAAEFDLRGRWGFTWALTCSRPRTDGFGGGAQLLDLSGRMSLDWIDCDHWLAAELADDDPGGGPAPASSIDDPSGPPLAGRSVSGDGLNWSKDCAYDDAQKQRFHATARARLRQLADALRMPSGSYDLRSNKAGVAVSGEITLHHEAVYIQVSQSALGGGMGILIRTCRGRRDYTGGANTWAPLALLDDVPSLAAMVRRIAPGVAERPDGVGE